MSKQDHWGIKVALGTGSIGTGAGALLWGGASSISGVALVHGTVQFKITNTGGGTLYAGPGTAAQVSSAVDEHFNGASLTTADATYTNGVYNGAVSVIGSAATVGYKFELTYHPNERG